MTINVKEQPSTIKLEEVFTNMADAMFRVNCRDMGGHSYSWGICSRCGHDITPDEEEL